MTVRSRSRLLQAAGRFMPVMVVFLLLTVACLFLAYAALSFQSTVRAFVHGEGLWSKAQKDAVFFLQSYAETGNPEYYRRFEDALAVTMGDRRARLETLEADYSYEVVLEGFVAGGNHPEDLPGIVRVLRCCSDYWYVKDAIDLWEQGDEYMLALDDLGEQLHNEFTSLPLSPVRIDEIKEQIQRIDEEVRPLELAFSQTLNHAARRLNTILLWFITGTTLFLVLLAMLVSGRILHRIWQSESKYRALLDNASDALIVVDRKSGKVLESNRQAERMTGLSTEQLSSSHYLDFYPLEQQSAVLESHSDARSAGATRLDVKHHDGHLIPAEVSTSITAWEGHRVNLAIIRDITERVRVEADRRLAANALANIGEGVVIADGDRRILAVNKAYRAVTGYSAEAVAGKPLTYPHSDRHPPAFYQALWEAIKTNGRWQGEIWNRRKNGEIYPALLSISAVRDEHGGIAHYVGVFNDISSYKNYEARLEYLAHHDALTTLPNRIRFEDQFQEAIKRARRHRRMVGMLFIDLDGFKTVNDCYGHAVGDQLLESVAVRIRDCVRQSDVVARVGGDEFTVLLDDLTAPEEAALVAQKLLNAVAEPANCGGHELSIFASIGISYYPQDGDDVQTLLSNADAAMYDAKQDSRNTYRLFSPSMTAAAAAKLEIVNALHQALPREQFSLVYQPCVDLGTGEIMGVEALIRWRHPELGEVSPAVFIPLAEDMGLIKAITEWVLYTACRQAREWQDAGLPPLRVAVNVSARSLEHLKLVETIKTILRTTGWQARWLSLEITERVLMKTEEEVDRVLAELHSLGVSIAIDDFGTGYSSLSYLKYFLIDHLKIDRSFTSGVPYNSNDATIIRTIIAMANSLSIRTIGEGIETEQQCSFLREAGCHEGQGYLFSKPVPAAELQRLLQQKQKTAEAGVSKKLAL